MGKTHSQQTSKDIISNRAKCHDENNKDHVLVTWGSGSSNLSGAGKTSLKRWHVNLDLSDGGSIAQLAGTASAKAPRQGYAWHLQGTERQPGRLYGATEQGEG